MTTTTPSIKYAWFWQVGLWQSDNFCSALAEDFTKPFTQKYDLALMCYSIKKMVRSPYELRQGQMSSSFWNTACQLELNSQRNKRFHEKFLLFDFSSSQSHLSPKTGPVRDQLCQVIFPTTKLTRRSCVLHNLISPLLCFILNIWSDSFNFN
jgi:hypothetical protein